MLKVFFLDIWQSLKMTDAQYEAYLSLMMTIATTLLSIGISIFTLSTAFVVSKKESLRELGEKIEKQGDSLTLSKRFRSIQSFIQVMRLISKNALFVIASSFVTIMLVLVFKQITNTIAAHVIYLPIIMSLVFASICIFQLIKWYLKR